MRSTLLTALAICGVASGAAMAQRDYSAPSGEGTGARASRSVVDARTETIARLHKHVTVELTESRLEDVFRFIEDASGARLEPLWLDDRTADGLDPDALVTIKVTDQTLLSLLERILDRSTDGFTQATWQMTAEGAVQVGTKTRLNEFAMMRTYDVQDLLFVIGSFRDVPDLDLGSIVQGGGGGGSQAEVEVVDPDKPTYEERVTDLRDVIIANVEADQWIDNGGDGATIRFFNGVFLIRAAEYVHRQIDGAGYWPDEGTIRKFAGSNAP